MMKDVIQRWIIFDNFYNFPALESLFFLMLTALAKILFLALLALKSLNLSKSFRPWRRRFISIRLAQADSAHFSEILSASHALRTTRDLQS